MAFIANMPSWASFSVGSRRAVCCEPLHCIYPARGTSGNARRWVMSQSQEQPIRIKNEASDNAWVKAYKAYLARDGEQACRAAMEGYIKLGRGAVFVVDSTSNLGIYRQGEVRPTEGVSVIYVALAALEQKGKENGEDVGPILSRMKVYDPKTQFVIVFEMQTSSGSMQGADIVTPKKMPERTKPGSSSR